MKKIIIAGAIVLIAGLTGYVFVSDTRTSPVSEPPVTAQNISERSDFRTAENGSVALYNGIEGLTALEILESSTNVEKTESQYGEFVTAIGGKKADSTSEYWSFYVNGEYATEGAGSYVTRDSDKIEWRLEGIQ